MDWYEKEGFRLEMRLIKWHAEIDEVLKIRPRNGVKISNIKVNIKRAERELTLLYCLMKIENHCQTEEVKNDLIKRLAMKLPYTMSVKKISTILDDALIEVRRKKAKHEKR